MKYVYLLRSLSDHRQTYIGTTDDLKNRLAEHNSGKSAHTSKCLPWEIEVVIRFKVHKRAVAFEQYLKSGSGHAFAKRHLWSHPPTAASK
jgi:putative endonuclease